MTTKASDIEQAKAVKGMRDTFGPAVLTHLEQLLSGNPEIDRIVKDIAQEDEFAVMCLLMGTATEVTPLGQRPFIKGDSLTPDLLARFQPGQRLLQRSKSDHSGMPCFVEVKSTKKDFFTIGGSLLERRRRYADKFGLPLLIAVRFVRFGEHALWVIVADDRSKSKIRVTVQDWIDGLGPTLWDDYFIFLNPSLRFEGFFDPNYTGTHAAINQAYGALKRVTFETNLEHGAYTDLHAAAFSMVLEAFAPEYAETGTTDDQGLTRIVVKPQVQSASLSNIVYRFNMAPTDMDGNRRFDPSRLLVLSDSKSDAPMTFGRDYVERIIDPLIQRHLLLLLGSGNEESLRARWLQTGGRL